MALGSPSIQYGYQTIDVTLSTDTSAYASGDLIADTQVITNAVDVPGGCGVIHSLVITDEDDQGVAFDVYILQNSTSLGTENSAPSLSDANSRSNFLARIQVATSDYTDLGGFKVAALNNLWRTVQAASGTRDLYVAVVNSTGTPTFTASGLKFRFGIES